MKKAILLTFVFLIVLSSLVYATIRDPVVVWDFEPDPSTSNLTDQVGNNDSFVVDVRGRVDGINGYGWNFSGTDTDYVQVPISAMNKMNNLSIFCWVKSLAQNNPSSSAVVWWGTNTAGDTGSTIYISNAFRLRWQLFTSVGSAVVDPGQPYYLTEGKWAMLGMVYNGTTGQMYAYHNDTLAGQDDTLSGTVDTPTGLWLGSRFDASINWFNGTLDECYIWDIPLTQAEVTELWNSGTGSFYPFGVVADAPAAPTIQPPSPANNANNNTNVTLNVSHSSGLADVQYYLYFGDTTPLTEEDLYVNNATRDGDEYKNFTTNVSDGTYYWKWRVQNISNGIFSSNTTQRTWILDTASPTITLNPSNSFDSNDIAQISQYANYLFFNITAVDDSDLFGFLVNVTKNGVSYFNYTNTSFGSAGNLTFNFTQNVSTSSWPIGVFNVTISASDSHTVNSIENYDVSNGINSIIFNTPEGNRIKISSDGSAYSTLYNKKKERYEFGWNYLFTNPTRKFTLESDNKIYYLPNSKYKGHFVILSNGIGGNWVDFEGIGNDYSVKKVNDKKYEITFTNLPLTNTIISNSLGGVNLVIEEYKWYNGNYSTSAPTSSAFGNLENFTLNISRNNTFAKPNATFIYNGVGYSTTSSSIGEYTTFSKLLLIPQPEGQSQNINYSWNVNITQSDDSVYFFNISSSVNVSESQLSNCSAYNVTTLSISFINETNLASLNASFNVLFEYGINYNNLTFDYSVSGADVSNYSFCIVNPNIIIYADVEFEYTNSLSDTRRYYLLNVTLTNNTQSLELLLIDSTLSDLITLIVDDEDDNAISNAYIKTQRWYLAENKYRTVEISRTDYDGVAGQHLIMNTVPYRFIIEKDFEVLPPTPTAATPIYLTTLYFQLFTRGAYLETFSSYENIRYTFEYNNNTRNFTFFYSDVTGVSTTGCLQVKHSTMLRTLIDYDECTTANAATLSYAHPDETITYIGTAYIQPSNSPTTDTVLKILTGGGAKLYQIFGETGLFLSIIFAVVLGGLGAMTGSAAIAIVFFLLGIIIPVIIGITYLSYTVLVSVVILLGLVMWRLRK